jgi:osmotically inducible protein OsmC
VAAARRPRVNKYSGHQLGSQHAIEPQPASHETGRVSLLARIGPAPAAWKTDQDTSGDGLIKPRDEALNSIMKILFTAEAISKGGRSGTIQSPDQLLNLTLGNPLEPGAEKRGPNPELLFAGAYSACYHGALRNAAKTLGAPVVDSTARALVSLYEDDHGGYHLSIELHAHMPGLDHAQVKLIMDAAHKTCPYSKALHGDTPVKLVVD